MKILLSNDDGYLAPGIRALAQSLAEIAQVCVVAPDRDRSGASNSLTLDRPLRVTEGDSNCFCVDGTPTDCVHLAVTGLLDYEPDIVLSGVNAGANMGDDTLYSGTVAAAMEGRFLGLPAIAVSLVGKYPYQHFSTACQVVVKLLKQLELTDLPANTILNINVPDLPMDQLAGVKVTRLGQRHRAEPVVKSEDPRGRAIYWVGPAGPEQDAGPGTDFDALKNGYVSLTPLHVDLTQHGVLDELRSRVGSWAWS